ncbi:MAG TPA: protein kinase, partial [Gemmataceae bacterium]|nr:protein kinase [Gemmataceae bacterium]
SPERRELAHHLQECAACREAWDHIRTERRDAGLASHAGVFAAATADHDSAKTNDMNAIELQSGEVPAGVRSPSKHLTGFDRYEILSELGRGGMGVVYKARDRELKRLVAIKMILAGAFADNEQLARFRLEAEAVARLDHPNIVQIYETGTEDGRPYFVLEFLGGGTLAQMITGKSLPPHEAAALVQKLAEAVDYAHQRGVVHRDLKPANILLEGGDELRDVTSAQCESELPLTTHHSALTTVKIADFGLAKLETAEGGVQTKTGDVLGTPSYMAPEQAAGLPGSVGPAVDIYALGAILYECLTGKPPFDAPTPVETLRQVVESEAPSVRRLRREVPRDLDTIVAKCLEKAPARRYASAGALAEELNRFLLDQPIQARPISSIERVNRWCRRNPGVAAALAVVGMLLVVATVASGMAAVRFSDLAGQRENARLDAEKAAADARWRLYQSLLSEAANSLRLNNGAAAKRALANAPPEFRRWEWNYYNQQLDLSRQVIADNGGRVFQVAFSPCGRWYAAACSQGVRVWSAADGTEVALLPNREPVRLLTIAFAPNGDEIAVGSDKWPMRVWSLKTKQFHDVAVDGAPPNGSPWQAIYSPDGRRVALHPINSASVYLCDAQWYVVAEFTDQPRTGCSVYSADSRWLVTVSEANTVRLRNAENGKQALQFSAGHRASSLAISPDGKRLAIGSPYPENCVSLWDTATGKIVATLRGHTNAIAALAFSPDSSRLASASTDQTARLWDSQTGRPVATLRGHTMALMQAAFSPDGRFLATSSADNTIRQWDLETGEVALHFRGHEDAVHTMAYSPDGTTLITGSDDGTVRLWDTDSRLSRTVLRGHTSFVYDLAFHPDGRQIASSAWDGTVRVWNADTGQCEHVLQHEAKVVSSVRYCPGGGRLLSVVRDSDQRACGAFLWDVAGEKLLRQFQAPGANWRLDSNAIAHASWIALGSGDGLIRVWDGESKHPAELAGHERWIKATGSSTEGGVGPLAIRPDGRQFASAGLDGTVRIWDAQTHAQVAVLRGHTDIVHWVGYSPDGRVLASSGSDRTVRLWDAETGNLIDVLEVGAIAFGGSFHPTEPRLALACSDSTIRLLDMNKLEQVAELRGHTAYVHAVAFSPDGTHLASASGDGTVRIWSTIPPSQHGR